MQTLSNLEPGVRIVSKVLYDIVKGFTLGGVAVLVAVHHGAVIPVRLPHLASILFQFKAGTPARSARFRIYTEVEIISHIHRERRLVILEPGLAGDRVTLPAIGLIS